MIYNISTVTLSHLKVKIPTSLLVEFEIDIFSYKIKIRKKIATKRKLCPHLRKKKGTRRLHCHGDPILYATKTCSESIMISAV